MKYLILASFFFSTILFSQEYSNSDLDSVSQKTYPTDYVFSSPQIGGQYVPAKTLNNTNMNILFIFAQFSGDNNDINDTHWPINSLPDWASTFIATNPNQLPFPQNTLSDYFYQMSNGQNIVVGTVYPSLITVLGNTSMSLSQANLNVVQQVNSTNFNFSNLDNWDLLHQYNQSHQKDTHLDAICIIWRNIDAIPGGYASILVNFITHDNVKIYDDFATAAMTINIGKRHDYAWSSTKLSLIAHEYGHYLIGMVHDYSVNYGEHIRGEARRGLGLMDCGAGTADGVVMNPWEKYLLGYITYTDIFYDQTGTLSDFNTTGQVYRFPIPTLVNGQPNLNPNEYFLVANHQRISAYETLQQSGVTVYHVLDKNLTNNNMRVLPADGLWHWKVTSWVPRPAGYGSPVDWYEYHVPNTAPDLYAVLSHDYSDIYSGKNQLEQAAFITYPGETSNYWWETWLDPAGNPNPKVNGNYSVPFDCEYNNVFSPWSNPATIAHDGSPVYTGFKLLSKNQGVYNMQFYVGETSCLNNSPSKPQNLQLIVNTDRTVTLTWDAYRESNMRGGQYEIYRGMKLGNNFNGYTKIATINSSSGKIPKTSFLDANIFVGGTGDLLCYKICAVNNLSSKSVYSDSVTVAFDNSLGKNTTKAEKNIETLFSNYPNPFNPTTNISYTLKNNTHVSIKIFDILGNIVAELVNCDQEKGSHSIQFDAVKYHLSSGVYFCTFNTIDQNLVRKLVILK